MKTINVRTKKENDNISSITIERGVTGPEVEGGSFTVEDVMERVRKYWSITT